MVLTPGNAVVQSVIHQLAVKVAAVKWINSTIRPAGQVAFPCVPLLQPFDRVAVKVTLREIAAAVDAVSFESLFDEGMFRLALRVRLVVNLWEWRIECREVPVLRVREIEIVSA